MSNFLCPQNMYITFKSNKQQQTYNTIKRLSLAGLNVDFLPSYLTFSDDIRCKVYVMAMHTGLHYPTQRYYYGIGLDWSIYSIYLHIKQQNSSTNIKHVLSAK